MTVDHMDHIEIDRFLGQDPGVLGRMLDALPHGVLVLDAVGRINYGNTRAQSILGLTRGQLLTRTAMAPTWRAVHADGTPFLPEEHPALVTLRTGQPLSGVLMGVPYPDGALVWIEIDSSVVARSDDGTVSAVVAAFVDVSNRIAAESAAADARQRTIGVLERIGDGVYALDREWRFTYVNPQAEACLRSTSAELLGQRIWDAFPESRETPWFDACHQAVTSGAPTTVEIYYPPFTAWYEGRIYPSADGITAYFRDVTERYRAATALRTSEAQHRALVEQVPVVVYTERHDPTETFAYISPYVESLLGLPPDAFLGDRGLWTRCIHPEDRARVRAITDRTIDAGERFRAEYRLIAADGRIVWVEDTAELTRDDETQTFLWQGVALDITARKLAQEHVAASEVRFRSLVQHAADLISVIAADGSIRYQSPALERLLGYRPDERVGAGGLAFLHPEDLPPVHEALARIRQIPGAMVTVELRAQHRDGSWRWLEATATNLLDEPSVGGIVVNSRDVTERKHLEVKLREREARHRALLDAVPDLMIRLDRSGTYLDVQAEQAASLVAPPDVLRGQNIAEALPAEITELVHAAMERTLASGRMQTFDYRLAMPDGPRDFEARMVASGTDETVSIVRDVTEQRAAGERLHTSEERFRLALEAARIGVWDWHRPTDVCVWSPTLSALLGLPEEQCSTTTETYRATFVHPGDRGRARAAGWDVGGRDTFVEFEYRVIRADGEIRWLVDIGRVVEHEPDGTPLRWAGVTVDVTDLKAANAAIELRDRALAATSSGVIIADATRPGRPIVDANPGVARITGYAKEEVVGCDLASLIGRTTDPATRTAFKNAVAEGREETVTFPGERKDGTPIWSELHLAPVRDSNGVLTHVVGILNDVTERRWTEEELRFRGELLDQATVAVIATDPAEIVTHWNRHAETLYGWSRAEAIGRSMPALGIAPNDAAKAEAIVDVPHAGASWEGEFVSHRKDGMEMPVHLVVSPVRNAHGEMAGIVGVSVDISERKAFEAQLAHQAFHDPLTGLPNRALFVNRLGELLTEMEGSQHPLAVLFVDLNDFKVVNDSLGHAAGDRLLVAVGQRLASGLGPETTLARFGGDEFTLLLPDAPTTRDAVALAERLVDRLLPPFVLEGREIHARASVGIALSAPGLATATDLLRAADIALYEAKATGTATYRVFEPGMAESVTGRMDLEGELRRAVERNELRLFYQPEVDLRTGAIVGAEALVRWQHPRRGLLPPGAFISLAEESDLIVPIGAWVLEEACRQFGEWRTRYPASARLMASVNLSARQLRVPNLPAQVMRSVRAAGMRPNHLKLEITERVVVEDAEGDDGILQALRQAGFKLAIDDFGTGYSSLGYLRRWPVDTLKIDRSFLNAFEEDPESRLLVGAMVNLAHALTMDVTAEGIETADQLACVRHMGVARGQGYFFAPPLPAEEFACLLAQGDRYDVGPRRTASAGRKRSRTTEPQVTTTKGQPGQILPG